MGTQEPCSSVWMPVSKLPLIFNLMILPFVLLFVFVYFHLFVCFFVSKFVSLSCPLPAAAQGILVETAQCSPASISSCASAFSHPQSICSALHSLFQLTLSAALERHRVGRTGGNSASAPTSLPTMQPSLALEQGKQVMWAQRCPDECISSTLRNLFYSSPLRLSGLGMVLFFLYSLAVLCSICSLPGSFVLFVC